MSLSLLKAKRDRQKTEKRVFPRFPFSSLVFKESNKKQEHAFEVNNISFSGMQLNLKDGNHDHKEGDLIVGILSWKGSQMEVKGRIKWAKQSRLGMAFEDHTHFRKKLRSFFSVENIVDKIKAVHHINMNLELPGDLKYWLRADGLVEIFVWRHQGGDISRFQIVLIDHFVEWMDGKGIHTGLITNRLSQETPLKEEDEFTLKMDEELSGETLSFARDIVDHLTERHLAREDLHLLKRKLAS